ncbi:MAG: MBL fold metallo-hydrolase [Candidatus Pacebacteria bacterium]|nr:MBL fold metallo-hydrolase [Candidatus Paceibacterota bacterium]
MKVTKFGHSCFLIKEDGINIVVDPGVYSSQQNNMKGIDLVLITHNHKDHCDIYSVKAIIANNPEVKIATNSETGNMLEKEGISFELIEDKRNYLYKNVLIEGFGDKHAFIYDETPKTQNTGYFIGHKLFFPGDSLYNPQRPVPILALPVAGPWVKTAETIKYAKEINPAVCFPLHDGMLESTALIHRLVSESLAQDGIKFVPIKIGEETVL